MPEVFISYSADAKKWAEKLASSLRQEGLVTWSDFENLSPGERWFDQIQEALDRADFYVVVLGPRSLMTDPQDRECQGALERTWSDPNKRIIPVLIGNAAPPAFLRNWVPIRVEPGRSELRAFKKVTEIIKKSATPGKSQQERNHLGSGWRKRIRNIESTAKRRKSSKEPLLANEH
jgi:TIR domain